MDNLLRFSSYDIFAYLAAGLAALGLWDVIFHTRFVLGADWTAASGIFTIVAAYVAGQILASPAALVMEHGLVKTVLGSPSVRLMASDRPRQGVTGFLAATIFREYFRPIDASFAARVRAAAPGARGESLFWKAYPLARADEMASARLESFIRLYGFCRNIAFVALLATVSFAADATVGIWTHAVANDSERMWQLTGAAALICLGMTHRYLKFHRLYTLETFVVLARDGAEGGK